MVTHSFIHSLLVVLYDAIHKKENSWFFETRWTKSKVIQASNFIEEYIISRRKQMNDKEKDW